MTIKLLIKDGKLVVKDGKLIYIDTDNPNPCECCEPVACCPDPPADIQLFFEDLDNAFEGEDVYPANLVFSTSGADPWLGTASDEWACGSNDMDFELTCLDGVYSLALQQSEGIPWPGMELPGGLVLTSTSVDCDPFTIIFEFTSDVEETACWTAKTAQHFRITITAL